MTIKRIQYGITLGALLIAVVHIIWPTLSVDAITVTLLCVAIVPWLAPLFKAIELPGGVKFEFQEFERTKIKADEAGLLTQAPINQSKKKYSFQLVAEEDPKLALAGLRIEIEKRLTEMADVNDLSMQRKGIGQLLRILGERNLLSSEQRSVLADMVGLLNSAVHGGEIDKRAAEWALDVGPRLLTTLESKAGEGSRDG